MAEEHTHRRLAAILAADVVGYGRLMEHDEAAALDQDVSAGLFDSRYSDTAACPLSLHL
jgi:class 3 adenylate cyclase